MDLEMSFQSFSEKDKYLQADAQLHYHNPIQPEGESPEGWV
jgi:hypothetical protein